MRSLWGAAVLFVALVGISSAASTYELEAKKFITDASERYYKLYNKIAEETYSSTDDEDFDAVFSKITNVQKIASELVEISQEASDFDTKKIVDQGIKKALKSLSTVGDLFVLGEEYFTVLLMNFASLKALSTDKDITPYLGGANMPNQDDSDLAYFPDIQKIFQSSNDPDELKYYWETWREKNSLWATVNFHNIIESFQTAAKKMEIPILEHWYDYYNNKDFLKEMEAVMDELKPAYQQLHAFVRRELHKKYGSDVIDPNGLIPDHLFQQVLDQTWKEGSIIESYFPYKELPPYDEFVKDFDAVKMIDEADRFYTSLGFDGLDEAFRRDRLKEHDEDTNSGDCKADIFDLTPDVYMRYCQKVDFRKFMQNFGYMSRVHYAKEKKHLPSYFFNSYDLEYPIGEAVILSASSPKHLAAIGLAKDFKFTDKIMSNRLFRMGIHTIFNIPVYFVHGKVMNDLLDGKVEPEDLNKYYWKQMAQYAGVEPPVDRPEGSIDFPYKFYLDMEENYQTVKFVSEVLGYQFYRAFCKKSGQVDELQNCDFYGNLAIGHDLKSMMSMGSSKPWDYVISQVLPENSKLSADAILQYYAPILEWVKKKNTESKVKIGWNESRKRVI